MLMTQTQSYQDFLLKYLGNITGDNFLNVVIDDNSRQVIQEGVASILEKENWTTSEQVFAHKPRILRDLADIVSDLGVADRKLVNDIMAGCIGKDYFANLGYVCDMLWSYGYRSEELRNNVGASRNHLSKKYALFN